MVNKLFKINALAASHGYC